jgi:di/tripeptidase
MKFRVGQRVELIEDYYDTKIGTRAVIVKTAYRMYGNIFIGIKWISGSGVDGGYLPEMFRAIVGEQQLFSFMLEKSGCTNLE